VNFWRNSAGSFDELSPIGDLGQAGRMAIQAGLA